jgi:restriction endonuclease S subunit
MKLLLKEIADIFTGQTFRSKVENNPKGEVWAIQMKDLNASYTDFSGIPNSVTYRDISSNQLLKRGDILFLAKGNNNIAFQFELDRPAIAVSLFFIIRVNSGNVLPGYLTWFLNNHKTQKHLVANREGAMVYNVKKSVLEELEIDVPDIRTQEMISRIYKLSIREEELLQQLIEEKKQLIQSALTKIV